MRLPICARCPTDQNSACLPQNLLVTSLIYFKHPTNCVFPLSCVDSALMQHMSKIYHPTSGNFASSDNKPKSHDFQGRINDSLLTTMVTQATSASALGSLVRTYGFLIHLKRWRFKLILRGVKHLQECKCF
jgi:hypothetical protein